MRSSFLSQGFLCSPSLFSLLPPPSPCRTLPLPHGEAPSLSPWRPPSLTSLFPSSPPSPCSRQEPATFPLPSGSACSSCLLLCTCTEMVRIHGVAKREREERRRREVRFSLCRALAKKGARIRRRTAIPVSPRSIHQKAVPASSRSLPASRLGAAARASGRPRVPIASGTDKAAPTRETSPKDAGSSSLPRRMLPAREHPLARTRTRKNRAASLSAVSLPRRDREPFPPLRLAFHAPSL